LSICLYFGSFIKSFCCMFSSLILSMFLSFTYYEVHRLYVCCWNNQYPFFRSLSFFRKAVWTRQN
jgi:hypothetical protein